MVKTNVDELVSKWSNGNIMDLGTPPTHQAKKLQVDCNGDKAVHVYSQSALLDICNTCQLTYTLFHSTVW